MDSHLDGRWAGVDDLARRSFWVLPVVSWGVAMDSRSTQSKPDLFVSVWESLVDVDGCHLARHWPVPTLLAQRQRPVDRRINPQVVGCLMFVWVMLDAGGEAPILWMAWMPLTWAVIFRLHMSHTCRAA